MNRKQRRALRAVPTENDVANHIGDEAVRLINNSVKIPGICPNCVFSMTLCNLLATAGANNLPEQLGATPAEFLNDLASAFEGGKEWMLSKEV